MKEILSISQLTAGYKTKRVLEDISLVVSAGQFVSIVAPNGTGKSTLLKTIAGVLPPLAGSICIQGKAIGSFGRRELAQRIAVVGSEISMPDYTVREMVAMGRFAHMNRFSGPSAVDQKIVQAALEDVQIADKQYGLCSKLSQGERQKVIIARALAQQPELLLLDEPTAHLDICNQFSILQLIKNLARDKNLAVIAVLHDLNLALQFSTELLFLKNGGVLAYGEPQQTATPAILQQLYGMEFTLHRDAAATYVRPIV
jgi:iron complex transport system ATP-binding protein